MKIKNSPSSSPTSIPPEKNKAKADETLPDNIPSQAVKGKSTIGINE